MQEQIPLKTKADRSRVRERLSRYWEQLTEPEQMLVEKVLSGRISNNFAKRRANSMRAIVRRVESPEFRFIVEEGAFLPTNLLDVGTLAFQRGYSIVEISEQLGISKSTARKLREQVIGAFRFWCEKSNFSQKER